MTFMLSLSKLTSTIRVYCKIKVTLYLVPQQNLFCEYFTKVAFVSFKDIYVWFIYTEQNYKRKTLLFLPPLFMS